MNDEVIIYTVKEVAKLLHTSPNRVYDLIDRGYIKTIKIGSLKVLKSSLLEFLEENIGKDLSDLDDIKNIKVLKDE